MSRGTWIGVFVGVILVGLGLAVITALATNGPGTTTTSSPSTTSVPGQFDLPFALRSDTLALAKHQKNLLVGIAAKAGGPIEVAAVRAEDPVSADEIEISVDGKPVEAGSCGRGCFSVAKPVLDGRPSVVEVHTGSSSLSFALPRRLPPSGASAFARARRTMAALGSYHFTERLSSGQGAIFTRLDVQAPDRLRLRTDSGFRSVIMGGTRWDFLDGRWQRQRFPGFNVREVLMWYQARTPRVVRRDANGDVELAAFSLKPVPSWFTLTVEPSGRVTQARMNAPSHFMLHRYSKFDQGAKVTPPR
jgi:hypothetical protein